MFVQHVSKVEKEGHFKLQERKLVTEISLEICPFVLNLKIFLAALGLSLFFWNFWPLSDIFEIFFWKPFFFSFLQAAKENGEAKGDEKVNKNVKDQQPGQMCCTVL